MRRAAIGLLLAACEPQPTTPPEPTPPPAAPAAAGAQTRPEPEPEPEPLKGPVGEGYLLVLDDDGALRCLGMDGRVDPDHPDHRRLTAYDNTRVYENAERLVDASLRYGPGVFVFDSFPAVGFDLTVADETVTLSEPTGSLGKLSECAVSLPLGELPWFADPGECAVAVRTQRAPMNFGACAKFFPGPEYDRVPTRFAKRFKRGGTMWERTPNGCEEWTFARKQGRRTVTRHYTADGKDRLDVYRVSWESGGLHREGPQHFTIEDGTPKQGPYTRCLTIAPVLDRDHDDYVKLGDVRWYYDRDTCRAAPAPTDSPDRC